MVLNCVFEPAARSRMLVGCRDHLVPGGFLYFAVPARCLDKSEFLTRAMLEGFFTALGLAIRDRKETPKIAFYLLERIDILPVVRFGEAPPPRADLVASPSALHGGGWRPRICVEAADHVALLKRLPDPPVKLSAKELAEIRGHSRTAFSIAVPDDWPRVQNVVF
jgi:hypothetical protein